ncbi:hypothetical protein PTKIN_Ptkin03bG0141200 [Pterospermum kingtungense]
MEKIRVRCGFYGCFCVDSEGRSGGLAMLWIEECDLHLRSYSKHHIDMELVLTVNDSWRITGIYGEPDASKRIETWSLIRRLATNYDGP